MPHMPRTKIAQNFFSNRVIHNWNNLPTQIGKLKLDDIYDAERFGQFLDKLSLNSIIPVPFFDYEFYQYHDDYCAPTPRLDYPVSVHFCYMNLGFCYFIESQ
jgi:hypothetical protein